MKLSYFGSYVEQVAEKFDTYAIHASLFTSNRAATRAPSEMYFRYGRLHGKTSLHQENP